MFKHFKLKKVNGPMQRLKKAIKCFSNERKSKKGFKPHRGRNFDEFTYAFVDVHFAAMNLYPLFLSSSESLNDTANFLKEYENYININQEFLFAGMKPGLRKKKLRSFKRILLFLFFFPQIINFEVIFSGSRNFYCYDKYCMVTLGPYQILQVCYAITVRMLLFYSSYKLLVLVYGTILGILKSAFRSLSLSDKISIEKSKSKEDEIKLDQIEESKKFSDKDLGYLSQVIKILRGGRLLPIREAHIYEFSELDQQNALLFVSSILDSMQFEHDKSEFKKLGVNSRRPLIRVKRIWVELKEFSSKLQQGSRLLARPLIYKAQVIIIGSLIFLMAANGGTRILVPIHNLSNSQIVLLTQPSVPTVLPRVAPCIDEPSRNMNSILTEMKDSMKDSVNTTSRLKSKDRVRKKAKVVRLCDLPSLTDKYCDLEIDPTPISRPTAIKIRCD